MAHVHRRGITPILVALCVAAAAVFACLLITQSPPSASAASSTSSLRTTVNWIKQVEAGKVKPKKTYRIAWVKADANNPYTIAERKAGLAAAKRYGAKVKVFDAKFNPNTQSQQLQDALTGYSAGKYDGILIEPVAGQLICSRVKAALKQKVPIGIDNSPICGDDGHTPGTTGYAGMQLQRYFDAHVAAAFKTCKTSCEAAVLTGPVGFDVVTKLQAAVKKMSARYPKVDVVTNQATDFSAQNALKVMSDALSAHPKISLVVSHWDDMMTGVIRAVQQAGKKSGKDVRIYSNGADRSGVKLLKAGTMNETSILMPVEEASYAMHQLMRFLITKKKSGTVWLGEAPEVTNGPGSIYLTKRNLAKWKPEY
jgi:ABC-type sugar transport system substrate-binding protein